MITEPFLPMLAAASLGPFAILAVAIAFIILLIVVFRFHAFIALMLGAFLVGCLAPNLPGEGSHFVRAVELATVEFGATAGKIGFVIALASLIGLGLLESGAADQIVRRLIAVLGVSHAGIALMGGGFILGVPVFFDTVFFLLVPLARALSLRAGKDYLIYILAICGGAVITHSVVAPTPGPLFMVETLNLDLGFSILVGLAAGIPPAVVGYAVAVWLNRRLNIPLRETSGMTLEKLNSVISKSNAELPPFSLSILPVALPVVLITAASAFGLLVSEGTGNAGGSVLRTAGNVVEFLGNKNIALLIGTVAALWLLVRQKKLPLRQLGEVMGPPLETAAVIILITAAGGAFGAMIGHAGVGESIRALTEGRSISWILLAWTVSAVLKIAQGSGTVAMITTAGIMSGVVEGITLPYHPVFLFLAIGFGSMMISWMNDSGFWVVGKLSGFTEQETLKTWTVLLAIISLVGLVETLVGGWLASILTTASGPLAVPAEMCRSIATACPPILSLQQPGEVLG